MIKISVIIATRNRADALEQISLPSLAKQDFKDFEVIIWDASDDDKSKIVVENFIQSHPGIIVRYFKAPRVGLASQRNDAVKVARGDIIFYIDDDSEVSSDGLSALNETFKDKDVCGVGLGLKQIDQSNKTLSFRKKIYIFYHIIFRLPHESKKRKVMLSGWPTWNYYNQNPGKVDWLSGCSMSFRKEIFNKFHFEEKLQKFGGYALAEDVQFSHSLVRNKMKLIISEKGYVIHHEAKGGRLENERVTAAFIYNHFIVWKTAVFPYNKLSIFVYFWSLIGEIAKEVVSGIHHKNKTKIKGILMGLKAVFID